MLPVVVGMKERPDQDHAGARGPDEIAEDGADPKEQGVCGGGAFQAAGDVNAAGNCVKRRKKDHERKIVPDLLDQELRFMFSVHHQDGKRKKNGNYRLIAELVPEPMGHDRQDRDGK